MEGQPRIIVPMSMPEGQGGQVDTKPIISRGIAVKKSEYLAMGPTPGCYGCKAIVRGDKEHNPHNQECRARVLEWLKRQDDPEFMRGLRQPS